MRRFVIFVVALVIAVLAISAPAYAKAKHTKAVKAKKIIECPYCGDGSHKDCVYWVHNGKGHHMTEAEIEYFCWFEWHWQDEDGEWHER